MPIEQDPRSNNHSTFLAFTAAMALTALMSAGVALWLPIAGNRQRTAQADLVKTRAALTNVVNMANEAILVSNRRQKFIDESFWHFARFLTNAHVREIELAPGRVSTFVDTNEVYRQTWSFTVTSTNLVAKKHKAEKTNELILLERKP